MTIEIPLNVAAVIIQSLTLVHEGLEVGGLVVVEDDEVTQEKIQAILTEHIGFALDGLRSSVEAKAAAVLSGELKSVMEKAMFAGPRAEA